MSKKASLSVVFYPQKDGGYTVICPELHGCLSEGDTYEEALNSITALIKSYLDKKNDEDKDDFIESLAVPGKIFTEINISI